MYLQKLMHTGGQGGVDMYESAWCGPVRVGQSYDPKFFHSPYFFLKGSIQSAPSSFLLHVQRSFLIQDPRSSWAQPATSESHMYNVQNSRTRVATVVPSSIAPEIYASRAELDANSAMMANSGRPVAGRTCFDGRTCN